MVRVRMCNEPRARPRPNACSIDSRVDFCFPNLLINIALSLQNADKKSAELAADTKSSSGNNNSSKRTIITPNSHAATVSLDLQ